MTLSVANKAERVVHLTLARKFESVQRNTVTKRKEIPRVLLPIPLSPSLSLKPSCGGDPVDSGDMEPIKAGASSVPSEYRYP